MSGKHAVFRDEHFHGGLQSGNVSEVVARLGLACEKARVFVGQSGNVGGRLHMRREVNGGNGIVMGGTKLANAGIAAQWTSRAA